MKTGTVLLSIAIALAWSRAGTAEEAEGAVAASATAEEAVVAPTPIGPRITFKETVHDAGESWQGDQVTHVFTFTNTGDSLLEISRVRASCGCTASNLSKNRVEPGESGEIKATFNTRSYRGRKSQPIYVTSNDPEQPTVQLKLETTIRTVAALDPASVQFGQVTVGKGAVREAAVVFDGEPFPVREVSAQPEIFSVRLLGTEEEGKRVRLEVSLSPETPVGRHIGSLAVRIDHPNLQNLNGRLLAVVEGLISYTPRMLFFNRQDQADVAVKTVSLSSQEGEPLEIRKVSSTIPQFTAELKTIQPAREYEVLIRLSPETEPGRYHGEVKIETSHPDQPVISIPVRANAGS